MEAGFGAQVEYHPAAVVGKLQGLGNQAIGGIGFVPRGVVQATAHHQRLVQLADAVLIEITRADRAGALECVWVEGVEGPAAHDPQGAALRSEEHTSELQSRENLVCRLLLEKKK